jgi:hypothetical protein
VFSIFKALRMGYGSQCQPHPLAGEDPRWIERFFLVGTF